MQILHPDFALGSRTVQHCEVSRQSRSKQDSHKTWSGRPAAGTSHVHGRTWAPGHDHGEPETPPKPRRCGRGLDRPGSGGGSAPRPLAPCSPAAGIGPCLLPSHCRQHYRVEVEHGAHQDEQESDGEDSEVQHGKIRPGRGGGGNGSRAPPHGPLAGQEGAGRVGPRRVGAGRAVVTHSARGGMGGPRRLLLVSNSTLHGGGYLGHCQEHIKSFLGE